jgi:hypothetical protein
LIHAGNSTGAVAVLFSELLLAFPSQPIDPGVISSFDQQCLDFICVERVLMMSTVLLLANRDLQSISRKSDAGLHEGTLCRHIPAFVRAFAHRHPGLRADEEALDV